MALCSVLCSELLPAAHAQRVNGVLGRQWRYAPRHTREELVRAEVLVHVHARVLVPHERSLATARPGAAIRALGLAHARLEILVDSGLGRRGEALVGVVCVGGFGVGAGRCRGRCSTGAGVRHGV